MGATFESKFVDNELEVLVGLEVLVKLEVLVGLLETQPITTLEPKPST